LIRDTLPPVKRLYLGYFQALIHEHLLRASGPAIPRHWYRVHALYEALLTIATTLSRA
jgi:hypothetical protein